jgi:hypothetical protein
VPVRPSVKNEFEEEVRHSVVKKVEMKGEAGKEVEQGSTAFSYNPEFTH